jgi:hypothetical protein
LPLFVDEPRERTPTNEPKAAVLRVHG